MNSLTWLFVLSGKLAPLLTGPANDDSDDHDDVDDRFVMVIPNNNDKIVKEWLM